MGPLITAKSVESAGNDRIVMIATTTSTENSGLLNYLLPEAEADTGFDYRVIAVGTGKALQIGRAGDVDVVMVHAKNAELEFLAEGHAADRTEIMYNDFVIVGPAKDTLHLSKEMSVADVFKKISANKALFISRGDDSGTHKKELQIWSMAGVTPQGDWYREVGQGMGMTLQMAGELQSYTMTDRSTWLFLQDKSPLQMVYEGDSPLFNQYSIMTVNPERHKVNFAGARALVEWISGMKGQRMIDRYKINGNKLFHANAVKP